MLCGCGERLDKKKINHHFQNCRNMKTKYNKLFQTVDTEITSNAKSIQDWENLKVMFEFLISHIQMMINKERKKPQKFPPEVIVLEEVKEPYEEEKIDLRQQSTTINSDFAM